MSSTFISYSTQNRGAAEQIEKDLTGAGVGVWIDHSEIRVGSPLVDAIQDGIEKCTHLTLLWSQEASESRYVKLEWQAAIQIDKPVIPCRLDETDLPLLLRSILYCDFRASYLDGLRKLLDTLGEQMTRATPPPQANPPALDEMIAVIDQGQREILDALVQRGPAVASGLQEKLTVVTDRAVQQWPRDAMILNLAGYHKKNAYMIKHWPEIQKGQSPQDDLLDQAERLFYSSLSIVSSDVSAVNGLGSVLLLRRDLDAAEFFVRRALGRARQQGIPYPAAEQDLETILRLKREV